MLLGGVDVDPAVQPIGDPSLQRIDPFEDHGGREHDALTADGVDVVELVRVQRRLHNLVAGAPAEPVEERGEGGLVVGVGEALAGEGRRAQHRVGEQEPVGRDDRGTEALGQCVGDGRLAHGHGAGDPDQEGRRGRPTYRQGANGDDELVEPGRTGNGLGAHDFAARFCALTRACSRSMGTVRSR